MTETDANPKMPPEIAAAVVSVMSKVKQLGKDEKNTFGKYDYVSVDKFFDQVGRLMAEAQIFVLLHEMSSLVERREVADDYGKVKASSWLICEYDVYLFHVSGASYGPIRRTIQVSATGPQAYGSAMSYAEKYFLRSLFKVPTGEADADADAPNGLPEHKTGARAPTRNAPHLLDAVASSDAMETMLEDLKTCHDRGTLHDWASRHSVTKQTLIEAHQKRISDEFRSAQDRIKQANGCPETDRRPQAVKEAADKYFGAGQ